MDKLATTEFPINQLIAKRWSPRAFDSSKPVPKEFILSICEAARWAPSCGGEEPWSFIVWDKFTDPKSYALAFDTLDIGNQKWVKNAPVLISVMFRKSWRNNPESINKWASFDTGSAAFSMLLQAFDLGLYAHPMAGFDAQKLRNNFQIPDDFEIIAMISIGFPGDPSLLEPTFYEREIAPRRRRPLDENFFFSNFASPISRIFKFNNVEEKFNVG